MSLVTHTLLCAKSETTSPFTRVPHFTARAVSIPSPTQTAICDGASFVSYLSFSSVKLPGPSCGRSRDARSFMSSSEACPGILQCKIWPDSENKMEGVFLGMPGPWASHMHEAADHYTTKIGGLPDWPIPLPATSVDLFKCSACKSDLSLLAQVYAPISKKNLNIEERVIYVFGCLMPECGSTTVSWRAIRIQKSVKNECLKSLSDKAVSSRSSSVSDSKKEREKDISSFDTSEEDDDEDDDDIDLAELGRALSEAASLASQSKKQNHGHKLTAKTSSPVCAARVIDKELPVIPCFYIYAEEEKFSKKDASVCSKNISSPIKDHASDPNTQEETWEVEDYEYDRALNADRVYLKFKKRVDAYPEQCFRYSYGGKPLLASGDAGDPGTCRLCGASRQYEMQLMPPLLYFLQEAVSEKEKHALDNWNWMTLIVYTCSQNCSNDNSSDDGWIVAEEAVVVQYE